MIVAFVILASCFIRNYQPQITEKDIVIVTASETFVEPGKKNLILIQVKVKEGYHIQANKVADESLIPVSLEITSNKFFRISRPVFPNYKLFRLEGTDYDLNVLDSIFIIQLPVKAMATVKDGRYIVKAKIRYQACNEKTCLFPRYLDLELPIIIQKHKSK